MEIARHWRLSKQRYCLVGEMCPQCEAKIFPPRDICPECLGDAKTPFAFSGKGEVYSYSIIYGPSGGFEFITPYAVAMIKLAEGPLVSAMLTDVDHDKIRIDMPVEMVTRKLSEDGKNGQIIYGYKFRPSMI